MLCPHINGIRIQNIYTISSLKKKWKANKLPCPFEITRFVPLRVMKRNRWKCPNHTTMKWNKRNLQNSGALFARLLSTRSFWKRERPSFLAPRATSELSWANVFCGANQLILIFSIYACVSNRSIYLCKCRRCR